MFRAWKVLDDVLALFGMGVMVGMAAGFLFAFYLARGGWLFAN